MSPFRETLPAGGSIESFSLDWITRCRPACILPVSVSADHGETRLLFHTEGLIRLAAAAAAVRASAEACTSREARAGDPDPAAWIRAAVYGMYASIRYAENCLLDRSRFRLDAGSVWFRPDDSDPHSGGRIPDPRKPVMTYVPLTGYRSETCLSRLVLNLYHDVPDSMPDARPAAYADPLLEAARQGEDALWEHLAETEGLQTSGNAPNGAESIGTDPDPTPPSRKQSGPGVRLPVVAATLLAPFLLAAVPVAFLFGPPGLQNLLPGRSERRMLAALSLILMMAVDSVILFSPRSPLKLPTSGALRPGHSRIGSWLAWISGFRRDVRGSGLAGVLARVLDRGARPGSPTEPATGSDGYERLGFLSEGEPGTPEETQGIRAYILTAEFLIGRDPDMADLTVPDESVGRVHARITRREGSFFVTDLGSVNGTRLDGRRLDRHVTVPMPDRCRIGFAGREFYFTAD